MNAFEFNKIAGAVLGTVLLVMVLQSVAGILYHSEVPEVPAYGVEVAGSDGDATGAEMVEEEVVPLAQLLAAASADDGAKIARKCTSCHTFDDGGSNGVGPNLHDIVGRQVASVDGYSYSGALSEQAGSIGTWSFEALDAFIADPKGYVAGTKMSFSGISREDQRADLLAYMREQSGSPMDLPVVEEAGMADDAMSDETMSNDTMSEDTDAAGDGNASE